MRFHTNNIPGLIETAAEVIGGDIFAEMMGDIARNGGTICANAGPAYHIYAGPSGDWVIRNSAAELRVRLNPTEGYDAVLTVTPEDTGEGRSLWLAVQTFVRRDKDTTLVERGSYSIWNTTQEVEAEEPTPAAKAAAPAPTTNLGELLKLKLGQVR
jgi:hypothetical protein